MISLRNFGRVRRTRLARNRSPYATTQQRFSENVMSESKHPKLLRSEELLTEAKQLVDQGDYFTSYSLLESVLEIQEKYNGDLSSSFVASAHYLLGLSYYNLQKYQLSEENYLKAIRILNQKNDSQSKFDLSLILLNYSRLKSSLGKNEDAIKHLKDSMSCSKQSGYEPNILKLTQLNNLSVLLVSTSELNEARKNSEQALDIAIRDLGRDNEYTRLTFTNLKNIIIALNDAHALQKLKDKFEKCDKITKENVKGVTSNEFNNILEEFTYAIKKGEPKCMPHGPVKGPMIYKAEITQFMNIWKEKGNTIDESILDPLKQEYSSIKDGEITRSKLTKLLTMLRSDYATNQRQLMEDQISSLAKERDDKTFVRDVRILHTENKFTQPIFERGDIPRFDIDGIWTHGLKTPGQIKEILAKGKIYKEPPRERKLDKDEEDEAADTENYGLDGEEEEDIDGEENLFNVSTQLPEGDLYDLPYYQRIKRPGDWSEDDWEWFVKNYNMEKTLSIVEDPLKRPKRVTGSYRLDQEGGRGEGEGEDAGKKKN